MMKLMSLFSDHAVFQRGTTIPVWGWTEPASKVQVVLGEISRMTVSSPDGKFFLRLPPLPEGGPFTLTVENISSGEKVLCRDIFIGEVYLVSGQSNMEFKFADSATFEKAKEEGMLRNPALRLFKVPVEAWPGQRENVIASWSVASEETAAQFSAVGFHFGTKLQRETGVAVGLIQAACGGTGAESWSSREALLQNPDWHDKVLEYDLLDASPALKSTPPDKVLPPSGSAILQGIAERFPAPPLNLGFDLGYASPEFDDNRWDTLELPDSWTSAGFNHAGVFWFRRTVELTHEAAEKELTLSLGMIDKGDITYFNGEPIGATGDGIDMNFWNVQRTYQVPARLVRNGKNCIAVRAASMVSIVMDGGLLGPAGKMSLSGKDFSIPLTGPWRLKMEHNCGTEGAEFMHKCGPGEPHTQHILFDNMIAPLIPYTLRGVLWYQGEANAICQAAQYRALLSGMIRDWRFRWGQTSLDFMIVQLPGFLPPRNFCAHSQWALLREAQLLTALENGIPPIVTLDWGDDNDLHPRNKQPVGEHAAALAAARIANRSFPASPIVKKVIPDGSTLRIRFETLSPLELSSSPRGWMLTDTEGNIVEAVPRLISPDTVEVSSPGVKMPCALHYGWSNHPIVSLRNAEGPASPFRWFRAVSRPK